MHIDKPENYKSEGVEITSFSKWDYDDESDVGIIIPKLESNTIFSGGIELRRKFLKISITKKNVKYLRICYTIIMIMLINIILFWRY